MSQRIAQFLLRWRWVLLGCAAVAGLVAYVPAKQLDFDRSIDSMFAPGDPLVAGYNRLKRVFGGNEIALAVYQDPELLQPDGEGVRRAAAIRQRLSAVPGVRGVLGIDMVLGESIVDRGSSLAEAFRDLFAGYTHGQDGRTAALACLLVPETQSPLPRQATIDQLRGIITDPPDGLAPGLLAGEPVMVSDAFRYIEQDGWRLGIASTALLSAVIVIGFRSLRWVLIPLAVVQLTLLTTRAALRASGLQLTIVSSMLTSVVTVVGVATLVHVIVRFRDARVEGQSPESALRQAITLLAWPVFWACGTDAAGFASLMAAELGPVRDYGLMLTIGSLLVMVNSALLVPGLALWGRWDVDPRQAWGERLLDRQLDLSAHWTQRHPWKLGLPAALAAGLISAGALRLQVETDFTKNFRADSPIVQSYQMVETHLGGAGVLDVILPAPAQLDWDYLQRVLHLEQRLRREVALPVAGGAGQPALTKVISVADAIAVGIPRGTQQLGSRLLLDTVVASGLAVMRARMPEFLEALYGEDPQQPGRHFVRVMLRAHERQPAEAKRRLIEQVRQISHQEFPQAEVTGLFVLLSHLIDSVMRDQWLTFALATVGITVMMAVAFRNVLLALVALVPNTIPILIVLGLMGWLGLRVNLGAAMIASVSMGLSVDSSIHYITSLQRALASGRSVLDAISTTQHTVGRAVVFSTLALVAGFSVLCTSQFVPTIYFGFLVSLTMLGGLAGNLVVLPLVLAMLARWSRLQSWLSR